MRCKSIRLDGSPCNGHGLPQFDGYCIGHAPAHISRPWRVRGGKNSSTAVRPRPPHARNRRRAPPQPRFLSSANVKTAKTTANCPKPQTGTPFPPELFETLANACKTLGNACTSACKTRLRDHDPLLIAPDLLRATLCPSWYRPNLGCALRSQNSGQSHLNWEMRRCVSIEEEAGRIVSSTT